MSQEIIITQPVQAVPFHDLDGRITAEETAIVRSILQRTGPSDTRILLPDTISDQDLLTNIYAVLKITSSMERAQTYLQPVIGRLMELMSNRPEILNTFGAVDMEDFYQRVAPERFKMSRSTLFNARRIVKFFPDITPQDYAEVGPAKLKAIGKAFDWENNSPKTYEYKKEAKDLTWAQLVEHMANDGQDVANMEFDSLNTRVPRGFRKRFNQFIHGKVARAYCGTDNTSVILEAMLNEIEADWTAVVEANKLGGVR